MRFMKSILSVSAAVMAMTAVSNAEIGDGAKKFEQLGQKIPTPNAFRAATGEPGPAYWQQQADFVIDVTLDTENKRIIGSETITYYNNSPHNLKYLWVQLDQNRFRDGSLARMTETAATAGSRRAAKGAGDSISYNVLARNQEFADHQYGFEIDSITSAGKDLKFTVVDSHLRIDLPKPLKPGAKTTFKLDWEHNIILEAIVGGRGGYEHFPETDTYQYAMAQWFPRMTVFSDYDGWHNKAFLGRGEFALEFGDYEVNITVPADHVVASTGELMNPEDVLTQEQRDRLVKAIKSEDPMFIITPEEALENEKEEATDTKTWKFKAKNVRDFAWSSSNKYIWDAAGFEQGENHNGGNSTVLAMSYYPNEAEPIWSKYSTEAVIHTMDVYNRMAFAYPYPTAVSVNAWERGGMEYPMMTFNGYRPSLDEKSGEITYSRGIKYGLIGVIIHEVGHIYFPMVVNSDERQWTWMDEGINSFLEQLAEYEWEENFPIVRDKVNPNDYITTYMTSENQVPIMTQSDSVLQFGPNAYTKPAAGLFVLREAIMGRELFDHAFREYSQRWMFKRPTPSDFFRTMEDASGMDLDWFWNGWFYSTDYHDVAITNVREYKISTQDPEKELTLQREEYALNHPEPLIQQRNREDGMKTRLQNRPQLSDFYNENDQFEINNKNRNDYKAFLDGLDDWERKALERALKEDQFIYFVDFENIGGLVMPIPMTFTYADGSTEKMHIPAEIWRRNAAAVTKFFIMDKQVTNFAVDVEHMLPDADRSNNHYPQKISQSRLKLYKSSRTSRNQMSESLVELKKDEEKEDEE